MMREKRDKLAQAGCGANDAKVVQHCRRRRRSLVPAVDKVMHNAKAANSHQQLQDGSWRTNLEALASQGVNGGKPTISAFAPNGMVTGESEDVGCESILIFLAQSQDTYKEDTNWSNDAQWAVEKRDRFGGILIRYTGCKRASPFTPSGIMLVPK